MSLKTKMKDCALYFARKLAVTIDFSIFLFKRAKSDAVTRVAASLSYTSLLALVPLFAIGLAIFSAFPMFAESKVQLQEWIINNFLPGMGDEISQYFNDFINASAKLTTIGVVGIAVTAVLLLSTIENIFNFLFKVTKPRRFATKITLYWTIITLGPLLLGAAFSLRGYLYAIHRLMPKDDIGAMEFFLSNIVPSSITVVLMVAIYMLVPNKKVNFLHALAGAIVTVILFAFLRIGFSMMILNSATYKTLYGAMATVPLLLVWMYMSWAVVLFGAVVTASLEEYNQKNMPKDNEPYKRYEKRNNFHRRNNNRTQRKNY